MDYDAIEEIENNIPSKEIDMINMEYDPNETVIATFNSLSDVDNFCNTYNHNNNYNGLKLGQRIDIGSNTWEIAGFDCESNNVAVDKTQYSNGYGIMLSCVSGYSGIYTSNLSIPVPYTISALHTNGGKLEAIVKDLTPIMGDHIITRNILASNSIDTNTGYSNGYIWTTAKATVPTIAQITGDYIFRIVDGMATDFPYIKYDIGEGNYKLPLYKFKFYMGYSTDNSWTRSLKYESGGQKVLVAHSLGFYGPDGSYSLSFDLANSSYHYIHPLIYIR